MGITEETLQTAKILIVNGYEVMCSKRTNQAGAAVFLQFLHK